MFFFQFSHIFPEGMQGIFCPDHDDQNQHMLFANILSMNNYYFIYLF